MNDHFIEIKILNEICKHGERTYPQECCGVLLGTINNGYKNVKILFPLSNEFNDSNGSKNNRYLISPSSYKQSEEFAKKYGYEILGFYHSHPDAPAKPSEFDRDHACPWYSYIIVSIQNGHPKELTGWQLKEDRSGFNEIVIKKPNNGEINHVSKDINSHSFESIYRE